MGIGVRSRLYKGYGTRSVPITFSALGFTRVHPKLRDKFAG